MILSMGGQAKLFLTAAAAGAIIGVMYDAVRVFRIIVRHKNVFVQIEDLLYWLFATGFVFHMALNRSSGEIRGFTVLGVLLGMVIYFLTASKVVLKAVLFITRVILRIIETMLRIIFFPIRMILKFLKHILGYCRRKSKKIIKPVKKLLRKTKKYVKMKKDKSIRDVSIIMKKK